MELFPNEEKLLSTYIKEKKVDFKKEDELVTLINYLDTIRSINKSTN
jgi:hypothetical protein